jgi:hypothetical protein
MPAARALEIADAVMTAVVYDGVGVNERVKGAGALRFASGER